MTLSLQSRKGKLLLYVALVLAPLELVRAQDLLNLNFAGTYRDKPKTSIVRNVTTGKISTPKHYTKLGNLVIALPGDAAMRHKYPELNKKQSGFPQKREPEELRNVEVDCWIHAVEFVDGRGNNAGDNEFHVILGSSPDTAKATYMTAEISGLPASGKNRSPLKSARKAFLDMFPDQTLTSSFKRISPARKVKVKGSLFFDGDHRAGCETCPGPGWAKPETVWEIHPVYEIQVVH